MTADSSQRIHIIYNYGTGSY